MNGGYHEHEVNYTVRYSGTFCGRTRRGCDGRLHRQECDFFDATNDGRVRDGTPICFRFSGIESHPISGGLLGDHRSHDPICLEATPDGVVRRCPECIREYDMTTEARKFYEDRINEEIRKNPKRGGAVRTPERHTIGDFMGAVMAIDKPEHARLFFDGYIEQLTEVYGKSKTAATSIARSNVGWCFGEGMPKKQMDMWVAACEASHPVFGTAMPTAVQAFEAGLKMGEGKRGER